MKTILATTSSFAKGAPEQLETLKRAGLEVVLNPHGRKLEEKELLELLGQYHPLGLLAGTEAVTRKILQAAKDYLRVISRVGAGWDNVDHQAAAELGMRVYRTPGVLTEAVAELTLGLILAALRLIPWHDRQIRQGIWQKSMGSLLQGKLVGLIGCGAIGRRVAELVQAFGARVIYYDPRPLKVSGALAVPLPNLLAEADIITLHASGKDKILGRVELAYISKPGVILINTARGGLVDEAALNKCLAEGRPAFACLDVFEQEPYRGPLSARENVILTSHIGSYAREARRQMEKEAVANLLAGLREVGAL